MSEKGKEKYKRKGEAESEYILHIHTDNKKTGDTQNLIFFSTYNRKRK